MTHMTCIYLFGHLQPRVEEKIYFVIQKNGRSTGTTRSRCCWYKNNEINMHYTTLTKTISVVQEKKNAVAIAPTVSS